MWMLSNFAILAGFSYYLRKVSIPNKKMVVPIFMSVFIVIAFMFIGAVYLIMLNIEPSAKFAFLINESYVLFDLFILILVATPLYSSIEGKEKSFSFYFFMAIGFVGYVIYDLVFARTFMERTYFSGGKLEVLYFLSYFLIYCAFYFRYKNLEKKINN